MLNRTTHLRLPELPSRIPPHGFSLRVRTTFDLEEAEAASLHRALGSNETLHFRLRKQITFSDVPGELSGTIGVHVKPQADLNLFPSDRRSSTWIHVNLELSGGIRGRDRVSEEWDHLVSLLMITDLPRVFDISAFWSVPLDDVAFAVALPIPLAAGEIPGFKEIRGVRIAQPDPDSPENDLYSLIFNRSGPVGSVQVQATIDSAFNADLLCLGFERALSIADLAVDFKGGDDA